MRLSGGKSLSFPKRWIQQPRLVLLTLISLNVTVFVAQVFVDAYQPGFVRDYLAMTKNGVRDAYAWQFVTAAFLHDGPWHLSANMFVLYFLGRDLETILGQRHFLYLYLFGAFAGELGHLFLMPSDCILFAASGGVAAVLLAYATVLPELELIVVPFVSFRLKAKHVGYSAVVVAFILVCTQRSGTVVQSAWLGGLAMGWLYAHLLGFGRPSFLQRFLARRRAAIDRRRHMDAGQFITEEIDPLLEKILRVGVNNLTRAERRILAQAREKLLEDSSA